MREVRVKLDNKVIVCAMIDYEENIKDGNCLFNLATNKVIIRRDAVFHEKQFSWKATQEKTAKKTNYVFLCRLR
jgi:hypothetical protein